MLFFLVLVACNRFVAAIELKELFEWKFVDYVWESEAQKQQAMADGIYDPTQTIIHDVIRHTDGRWFLSLGRSDFENPCSLATISDQVGEGGPLLEPYPSWDWHRERDCSNITFVRKLTIDDCGKLWVVDCGRITNEKICRPKILVFDLATNELVSRIEIPHQISGGGLVELQQVETSGENCENTMVYMSDLTSNSLMAFDGSCMWRHECDFLSPGSLNFSVNGIAVPAGRLGAGILAIGHKDSESIGIVAAQSFSRAQPGFTTTDILRNSKDEPLVFYTNGYQYPSQVLVSDISRDGIMFAGWLRDSNIFCWYIGDPLDLDHLTVLYADFEKLNSIASLKVLPDPDGREQLLIYSNRYVSYAARHMNFSDVNYRIMMTPVDELVAGTQCELDSKNPLRMPEEMELYRKDEFDCRKTAEVCPD